MKILITGTTSSGKSTLLESLKSKYKNIRYIDEIARSLLTTHPELETDPQLQDILFDLQTQAESDAAKSDSSIIICDRGIIDNIAHAHLFGQNIKDTWVDWCYSYDEIYVLNKDDIDFQITQLQTTLGTKDWHHFRNNLDVYIKKTIIELGMEYIVLSGTITERLTELETCIFKEQQIIEGKYRNKNERK